MFSYSEHILPARSHLYNMKVLGQVKTIDVFASTAAFTTTYSTMKANQQGHDSLLILQLIARCPIIHVGSVFNDSILPFSYYGQS